VAEHPRLSWRQINLLRFLAMRCGLGGNIRLGRWQRTIAVALWRRELIEIWYRQSAEGALQGPYFGLSFIGRKLALAFCNQRPKEVSR
jgi:hypothetical protein